jgi:hypothetical protein
MSRTLAKGRGAQAGPRAFTTAYGGPAAAEPHAWQGLLYLPSWGGSMFEALMPTLVIDESRHAPSGLGRNNLVHAVIQRRYATEVLDYPVWGISPSSSPDGRAYTAYGVEVLGSRGYPAGAVTPHASALALTLTPEPAVANLRELVRRYEIYGEYGLYDSVDPSSGRVAHTYLALDQGMLFVALANHLKERCIQRAFETDPIAQRALRMIGTEDFFQPSDSSTPRFPLHEAAIVAPEQASR